MTARSGAAPSIVRAIPTFPLVRIPLPGGVLLLGMGVSNGFMFRHADAPLTAIGLVPAMAALDLAVYAGFVRLVERRPVSELSLRGAGRERGIGLSLGFGLHAVCILILALAGWYRVES